MIGDRIMKRSEIRETIFILLFENQFYQRFLPGFLTPEDVSSRRELYLDGLKDGRLLEVQDVAPSEEDISYIREKTDRIIGHQEELDAVLNRISEGWSTKRMAGTDLSILRLAVYELCFDDEIPTGVAINEAVELAKKYGGEHSASFVNGILGRAAREIQS